jgi:hypothetical protein
MLPGKGTADGASAENWVTVAAVWLSSLPASSKMVTVMMPMAPLGAASNCVDEPLNQFEFAKIVN